METFPLERPVRLAVFASGRGSNLDAILRAYGPGEGLAEVVLVMSDVSDAGAIGKARAQNLSTYTHPFPNRKADPSGEARAAFEAEASCHLEEHGIDLICLAGFMRIFSPEFTGRWRGRMLNIHPSLLPDFPGLHPQRQALEAGVKTSGCSVHFVEAGVDTGPVILQCEVPVFSDDDEAALAARILAQEHRAYPEAIRRVVSGEVVYQALTQVPS